jgi:hypothetical protein
MIIYAQQRANTGVASRIAAADLFNLMNGLKTELQTQLSISGIVARTGMTPEQKKLYLDNAPAGNDFMKNIYDWFLASDLHNVSLNPSACRQNNTNLLLSFVQTMPSCCWHVYSTN